MEKKRVGIIGAGVSGLATAKVFLAQGHAVTVFEQVDTLGGVWAPGRRHPGLRLQTNCKCYAFSDFPMPSHYPEFPTGQQIYDYLESYAKHFGVYERLRCKSEVLKVDARPDGHAGWRIDVRHHEDASESAHDFDFVVVCNGIFSKPEIPRIPGREEFEANGGVVLHSSQVHDTAQFEGRSVVVVGFGKSALDIAETAAHAHSTALVYRRAVWKLPHRVWGRTNIRHFILSRFTEIWFPHPDMGWGRRFLHTWLRPLVDAYWRAAERVIGRQLGLLKPELRPDVPLRRAGVCATLALDDLKAIHEGRIALHRGAVARFTAAGLELDNGQRIAAQTVVLATGYRQESPFLGEREQALLADASGAILLYRSLVNPDVARMAFNGYNGVGACQLAAEVGACWLVRFMEGRLRLPDRETMLARIREEIALRSRLVSTKLGAGHYVSPFTIGYLDQLLRDLGLGPADRHRGLFDWLFEPLDPSEYRDLLAHADAAADQTQGGKVPASGEPRRLQNVH